MGAPVDVSPSDLRWLSPLPLWTGILAGPVAWALNLTTNYALVKPVCSSRSRIALFAVSAACFAIVSIGAAISWKALERTKGDEPTDGGHPRQRARFMAILGLASCALFALQIVAGTIPPWVLDACD